MEYAEARRPGSYRLLADGKVLMTWAVNIPAAELDLSMAPRPKVENDLQMRWIDAPGELERTIREARVGREYWRELLLAAVALLIIEMAIYREKGEPESGTRGDKAA